MTDKVQKIRNEVERLQNELIQEREKGYGSDTDDACILELQNVLTYIDSLQEEPVSDDFEEALAQEWKGYNDRGAATVDALEDNTQELAFAKGFYRGAKWQEKQDQETIELAEDRAMLAGIIKGTEHTIGNVRSILNKVAYENNGLDVNGDYCERPYVELDNEFKELLKEN